MSMDFADDQSTLFQVMAWCRQGISHYLSQCWPRSMSPYGVIRPQIVNGEWFWGVFHTADNFRTVNVFFLNRLRWPAVAIAKYYSVFISLIYEMDWYTIVRFIWMTRFSKQDQTYLLNVDTQIWEGGLTQDASDIYSTHTAHKHT